MAWHGSRKLLVIGSVNVEKKTRFRINVLIRVDIAPYCETPELLDNSFMHFCFSPLKILGIDKPPQESEPGDL